MLNSIHKIGATALTNVMVAQSDRSDRLAEAQDVARTWLIAFAGFALMGCSETNTVSKYRDIGDTRNLLTTADLRMITARRVPYSHNVRGGLGAGDHR